ncbi:MAG: hypothetical protein JST86_04320 [Bacteroidetes bacterium]|nr:hypothetical protein [Bacteroidota bacterium]
MSLEKIEHVVVLMLENRSFDSMLGWLYENDAATANYIPNVPGDLFRGLQKPFNPANFTNTALNGTLSAQPTRGVQGFTVPDYDPGEEFEHVNKQFFNTTTPPAGAQAKMLGVMADFVDILQEQKVSDDDIRRLAKMTLETFTPGQLPVLNQLAKFYAVCDDWFASVPSQTNPNRSFLMCGTSMGMVNNGNLEDFKENPQTKGLEDVLHMAIGDDRVHAPTIFNALNDSGTDWTVFWQTSYLPQKVNTLLTGLPVLIPILYTINPALGAVASAVYLALKPYSDYLKQLTSGDLSSSYTWRLFPEIHKIPNAQSHFQKLDDFHARARAGQLPPFSYIEPYWSISHTTNPQLEALFSVQGNDYHPPSNLLVGEEFVKEVYKSLISNRAAWEKTLLVITFDEFVGTFDHVDPVSRGAVQPPWGNGPAPVANPGTPAFDFKRLGARVPTILVSPYIQKNTVFRAAGSVAYDHTSVIATTLKWLNQSNRIPEFGLRTANAPAFDNVLTLNTPRTDERNIGFLNAPRKMGDPVQYGDSFILKNQNGQYLSSFFRTLKAGGGGSLIPEGLMGICVDLGIAAPFPTLGGSEIATMSFLTHAPDTPGQISNNAEVLLVSREKGLSAFNILGAWKDSSDCYYYDEYIDGDHATMEKWVMQKVSNPNQPLHYGDQFYLVNAFFTNQRLSNDPAWFSSIGWVTTKAGGDYWTVEPVDTSLQTGQYVVSWQDGYQSCQIGSHVDGTNCIILNPGQRVVSYEDGYKTCKTGSRVDSVHCLPLNAGQRVVSWDDGYKTCKPGSVIDGTHCVILNANQRVVSYHDGYQTCQPGAVIDGRQCLILTAGQRIVSWEDGFQTMKAGSVVDGSNCVVLNPSQKVVSWEDGFKTCKTGSKVDGSNCIIIDNSQTVASWQDGFKTCTIGAKVDGSNCVVLNNGQRVVSWDDGYLTCRIGSRVDGVHCLILNNGQLVVSWNDGYQSCKPGSIIDGTNCLVLNAGERVVSWNDGYQTCFPGSKLDGRNCILLSADQRVVSWNDGYQSLAKGSVVDGSNCIVLATGQYVASWQDGFRHLATGSKVDGSNCIILNAGQQLER